MGLPCRTADGSMQKEMGGLSPVSAIWQTSLTGFPELRVITAEEFRRSCSGYPFLLIARYR